MPLFSAPPIVLSDGTANHTFEFKAQIPDKSGFAGRFIEPAASSAVDAHFDIKHIEGTIKRHLISYRENVLDNSAVPVYEPVTINVTITAKKTVSDAALLARVNIIKNMLSVSGFTAALLKGNIS